LNNELKCEWESARIQRRSAVLLGSPVTI